ncbi:hypothetical protein EV401DRAFT_1887658 [Pisolithus croceorrhizus]|nr:hypothetical protein EV401DRAFT_1887658 [Pisolithus croceorrhizus]
MGEDGSGAFQLALKRLGGYYIGCIHLLLLGKLLGKQPHSYGDTCEAYLQLLPADLHNTIQPIWGINEEGELDSASCEIGRHGLDADKVASLWLLMGNLAMCWFFSKHVALQIKAYEDLGIFGVKKTKWRRLAPDDTVQGLPRSAATVEMTITHVVKGSALSAKWTLLFEKPRSLNRGRGGIDIAFRDVELSGEEGVIGIQVGTHLEAPTIELHALVGCYKHRSQA